VNSESNFVDECKRLISINEIDKAIGIIEQEIPKNSSFEKLIILKKGTINKIREEYNLGVLSKQDYDAEVNKVALSILKILDEIPINELKATSDENKKEDEISITKEAVNAVIQIFKNENKKSNIKDYFKNVDYENNANLQSLIQKEFDSFKHKMIEKLKEFSNEVSVEMDINTNDNNKLEINLGILTAFFTLDKPHSQFSNYPTVFLIILDNYPPYKTKHGYNNIYQSYYSLKAINEGNVYWFQSDGNGTEQLDLVVYAYMYPFIEKYNSKIPICKFCNKELPRSLKDIKYIKIPSNTSWKNYFSENTHIHDDLCWFLEICDRCNNFTEFDKYEIEIHNDWQKIYNAYDDLQNYKYGFKNIIKNIIFRQLNIKKSTANSYKKDFARKYKFQINTYLRIAFYIIFKKKMEGYHYYSYLNTEWIGTHGRYKLVFEEKIEMERYDTQFLPLKLEYAIADNWVEEHFGFKVKSKTFLIKFHYAGHLMIYYFISKTETDVELLEQKLNEM